MAINFMVIECPCCGAKVNVESFRDSCFCEYCGSRIVVRNDNEQVYRNIDDAKIKTAETERLIRLKELEMEEKEREINRKNSKIAYGIALILAAAGAFGFIFNELFGMFAVIVAGYIALLTYGKNNANSGKEE